MESANAPTPLTKHALFYEWRLSRYHETLRVSVRACMSAVGAVTIFDSLGFEGLTKLITGLLHIEK